MKKVIIFSVLGILFGASVAMGAIKAQDIKSWDYVAQIQTSNRGNMFIYKFEDKSASTTCYVLNGDEVKYAVSPSISCVK